MSAPVDDGAATVRRRRPALRIRERLLLARSDAVVKASMYIMATTGVTSAFGYLYWIVAAHYYTPTAIGLAAALLAAMAIVADGANLGLQSSLLQTLPGRRSKEEWSLTVTTAFLVGGGASALAGLGAAFVLPLVSHQFAALTGDWRYLTLFVAGSALTTLLVLFDHVSLAERAARNMFGRNAVFAVVKLPLLAIPAFVAVGALGVFGSWVGSMVITAVLGALVLRRLRGGYRPRVRGLVAHTRSLLSRMVGHHLVNVGGIAPLLLLPCFVTVRTSAADNAYFYSAWRVAGSLFMLAPAVGMSLFAEGSHDSSEVRAKARSALVVIGAVVVPVSAIAVIGANPILSLFGASYAHHGAGLLRVLTLAGPSDALNNIYVNLLRGPAPAPIRGRAEHRRGALALVLAWILLPPLGIMGAGVAWVAAQLVGTVVVAVDYLRERRAPAGAVTG